MRRAGRPLWCTLEALVEPRRCTPRASRVADREANGGVAAAQAPREQAITAFSRILEHLCVDTGSSAAALVDKEGETVDYHSVSLSEYDVRVMAAEWRLVLGALQRSRIGAAAGPHRVLVRAARASFAVIELAAGYCVVLLLPRRSFDFSERALAVGLAALCQESGLELMRGVSKRERWKRVRVKTADNDERKPVALWRSNAWHSLVILGRYQRVDLAGRDLGYRARMEDGAEFGLVREPLGLWYAENLD